MILPGILPKLSPFDLSLVNVFFHRFSNFYLFDKLDMQIFLDAKIIQIWQKVDDILAEGENESGMKHFFLGDVSL